MWSNQLKIARNQPKQSYNVWFDSHRPSNNLGIRTRETRGPLISGKADQSCYLAAEALERPSCAFSVPKLRQPMDTCSVAMAIPNIPIPNESW